MPEEQNDTQQPGEFYLEASYNATYNEVIITANEKALRYLRDLISWLAEAGTSGDHEHLDKASGVLDGDIASIIIQRK